MNNWIHSKIGRRLAVCAACGAFTAVLAAGCNSNDNGGPGTQATATRTGTANGTAQSTATTNGTAQSTATANGTAQATGTAQSTATARPTARATSRPNNGPRPAATTTPLATATAIPRKA